MKVLFPFVGDSVGGSHISALLIARELVRRGLLVHVVVFQRGPLTEYLGRKNIKFYCIDSRCLSGPFCSKSTLIYHCAQAAFKIFWLIRNEGYHALHCNDLRISLSSVLPALLLRRKLVWHQRTMMSKSLYWWLLLKLPVGFAFVSNAVRNSARLRHDHAVVMPNLYETEVFEKGVFAKSQEGKRFDFFQMAGEKDVKILMYAGRITRKKNIESLLELFAFLASVYKGALRLVLVGRVKDDFRNEIKRQCGLLGINEMVSFAGFINNVSMALASADLVICPSRNDGFGRVIVEAAIQGVPTVAADAAGHRDAMKRSYGRLFDPDDYKSFTRVVTDLLDEDLDSKRSRQEVALAEQKQSAELVCRSCIAMYERH